MNNLEPLGIQKVICTILARWDFNQNGKACLSVHNDKGRFKDHLHVREEVKIYMLDDLSILTCIKGIRFLGWILAYYKLIKRVKPKKVIAVNQEGGTCALH